jgi:uncharacterized membrane protein YhaH (DUF805 family)
MNTTLADIRFWIVIVISIATVILLCIRPMHGRGWLIAFICLLLIPNLGFYTLRWVRTERLLESTEHYISFLTVSGILAWVCLLLYVIQAGRHAVVASVPTSRAWDIAPSSPMTVARALFSFEGRLSRGDYWLKGFLPMLPVGIFNNILAYGVEEDWARALSMVIGLFSLWPALALIIKRLHDRDKTGWWALLLLVPIVGPLFLAVGVWFLKGTNGPNRFGPDPLQPAVIMAAKVPAETAIS